MFTFSTTDGANRNSLSLASGHERLKGTDRQIKGRTDRGIRD